MALCYPKAYVQPAPSDETLSISDDNLMSCSVCRMEETLRSLLQNQGVVEHAAVDTMDIMKAYRVNESTDIMCTHIVGVGLVPVLRSDHVEQSPR